ncbi:mesogenin-1 [Rhinophrynus dorsalis]
METLHQPMVKMEQDYVLCSDSDPDSTYLSSSWDWKHNAERFSLSPTPSPQSLSPAVSFESSLSACSQPQGLEEMPFSGDMMAYSLLHYPTNRDTDVERDQGGYLSGGHHGHKATLTVQRRRKASEREKLRMRAIAEALHTLRSNLPPIYNQGRQPLTKIQTLKCTINYISELTSILHGTKRT